MRILALLLRVWLLIVSVITAASLAIASICYPALGLIAAAIIVFRRFRGRRGSGYAHGTARSGDFSDLLSRGLLGDGGTRMILGRAGFIDPPGKLQAVRALLSHRIPSALACRLFLAAFLGPKWCRNLIISVPDYVHGVVFGPAGAGKGVGSVVVNLLHYTGSVVVNDPKGENHRLTAKHRKKRFKNAIVRLDPFGVQGPGGDAWNIFDCIDPAAMDFVDQVRDLANLIVHRSASTADPYWEDRAENVLVAMICFVVACERDPARKNLLTVRALVSSREAYTASVAIMRQTQGFDGVVKRQGDSLTWLQDKELSSVLSVVQKHTAWMDSPAVAACLSQSTFNPRQLKHGLMSLYLILPPERLLTLAPLMRIWIGMTLSLMTKGEVGEKRQVLFLIDEAAHLGKLPILENSLTLMRGYGVRVWLYFQSIGQLNVCYGDNAGTVLENLKTQQYMGTKSFETASVISKMIGDTTLVAVSRNDTTNESRPTGPNGGQPTPGNYSTGTSFTSSEHGRRLIKEEEILTLGSDVVLCFHDNMPVLPAKLLTWYDAPEFKWGRTGRNRGLGLIGVAACLWLITLFTFAVAVVANLPVIAAAMQQHAALRPHPQAFRRERPSPPHARSSSLFDRR